MTRIPYSDEFYHQALLLIGNAGQKLMQRSILLGTAESCTGGLLAALCTEMPGSSSWFAGGVVSYANSVKESLLDVDSGLILAHGAVSGQVVEAMARGVIKKLGATAGIAVSGIAGPGGGTPEKPVGTVWIGFAFHPAGVGEPAVASSRHLFSGSRQEIRAASVLEALRMILKVL